MEKSRIIKCPTCSNDTVYSKENEFRPFCSERCRIRDTASWAEESFKITSGNNEESDVWSGDLH